ncbi:hypothetical protein [Desulfovibrio sp. Fe33]|uniref:hypothetical protein n=1 Tax=Desulfovibrio sp. Fe33 TaxID=3020842 RepID=UPI00234E2A51|nr:hypothetical protein [Desulfovibrio sp. Fe33]
MENRSLPQRLAAFALSCAAVWVFTFLIGPEVVESSEAFQKLGDFIVEENIETGMFYYTDVEIVGHADHNARSTMEYMPHGPGPMPVTSSSR